MTLRRLVMLLVAIAAIVSPYAGIVPGWTPALATAVALNALALIGLNLIFGVVGMLAFGQAAFMALPGYGAGVLQHAGVPLAAAMALGIVITVIIARIVGGLFARLPGVFLAVGTLGFGFVVEGLARAFPAWTGGASGLVFPAGRAIGRDLWYAIAVASLALGLASYAWHVRGAVWRRLRTIRHDELAAAVLGIDTAREKARQFTIGSCYAAFGGLLLAYYVGVLVPEDAGVNRSLEQVGTVLMGGLGFLLGPLVGATLVRWLFVVAGYGARYELLIYGVVFLGVVIYARDGVMGWLNTAWQKFATPPKPRSVPVATSVPGATAADRSGICLEVLGVAKQFGGVQALADIDFAVSAGEIFAMVGPNGAGKSTLFNIISGIEAPSAGTVRLDGRDITTLPIARRAPFIGRSFQVARLVPELTALANLMVRLDQIMPGRSEREREAIALAQLDSFGLAALADQPVRTLSLGQHKLIDLARAAAGDPPLVLLDEPAVGLAAEELLHLAELLETLRSRGSAVLIVEHNIEFVAGIATRGIVLDSGKAIALGGIRDILADERVNEAYFGALA
jgi:branched-chain amino acid transport system permease protein